MSDEPLQVIAAGDVAIREDADGDGRTVYGYAYRWGEVTEPGGTAEYGAAAQGFDRGAFADAIAERGGRPWPFLATHRGTTVAGVTFAEDDIGLRYSGRLLDTPAARDYAASVPAGNDGVSLEFLYRGATARREGNRVILTRVPRIAALAGAYVPAFTGAGVALRDTGGNMDPQESTTQVVETTPAGVAVRDDQSGITARGNALGMTPEQVRELATAAATEAMRGFAERGRFGGLTGEADPLAGYRSLGELFGAAYRSEDAALRGYAARALADTVFTAGANAGLASGNLVTSTIARIVNGGRPIIEAFGGPRPLGDSAGLTLEYAYFNGTEALVTYAGGSDISYQVIRRGNPSILDAFARITLAAYAMVTDAAAATELETGSVTVDFAEALSAHDLSEFIGNVIDASLLVEAATGTPAEFVLLSTTAFAHYAKLIAPSSTNVVAASTLDLRGLRIGVGNLPFIHAPGITAGKAIVSNQSAGGWYEDGPFQVSAEDVEHLGRDVAWWGLGAFLRLVPAGIVEVYDVTP